MSITFGDVLLWLLPLLVSGTISACGLGAMLYLHFDAGEWKVTGPTALVLGLLALPALPLTYLINPALAQLAERSAAAEEWKGRAGELSERHEQRQKRLEGIEAREKELDGEKAQLRKNTATQGLHELVKMKPEARQKRAERLKRMKKENEERRRLYAERQALREEDKADEEEKRRALERAGWKSHGGQGPPITFSLPLVWGFALYGLGWLFRSEAPGGNRAAPHEAAAPTLAPDKKEP